MSQPTPSLPDIRVAIDVVDNELHHLVRQRAGLVDLVAIAKGPGAPFIHPAREMEILRRLAGQHSGAFPLPVLLRVWREMICATVAVHSNLTIGLSDPSLEPVARAHFGMMAKLPVYTDLAAAKAALASGEIVAVLVPATGGAWCSDAPAPIVAALPVVTDGTAPQAYLLGHLPNAATGDDSTVLLVDGKLTTKPGFNVAQDGAVCLGSFATPLMLPKVEP